MNKREQIALFQRLYEIQTTLENLKPLYKEADEIVETLIKSDSYSVTVE